MTRIKLIGAAAIMSAAIAAPAFAQEAYPKRRTPM